MRCGAVRCGAVRCDAVRYGVVRRGDAQSKAMVNAARKSALRTRRRRRRRQWRRQRRRRRWRRRCAQRSATNLTLSGAAERPTSEEKRNVETRLLRAAAAAAVATAVLLPLLLLLSYGVARCNPAHTDEHYNNARVIIIGARVRSDNANSTGNTRIEVICETTMIPFSLALHRRSRFRVEVSPRRAPSHSSRLKRQFFRVLLQKTEAGQRRGCA